MLLLAEGQAWSLVGGNTEGRRRSRGREEKENPVRLGKKGVHKKGDRSTYVRVSAWTASPGKWAFLVFNLEKEFIFALQCWLFCHLGK